VPRSKAFAFLEPKDPEQVRREAQHQAAHEAPMGPSRQGHEDQLVAKDAVATCRGALGEAWAQEVTEAEAQGGNPLPAPARSPEAPQCKDCGTGYCVHGCRKEMAGNAIGALRARAPLKGGRAVHGHYGTRNGELGGLVPAASPAICHSSAQLSKHKHRRLSKYSTTGAHLSGAIFCVCAGSASPV
jgi:hypothetical protein